MQAAGGCRRGGDAATEDAGRLDRAGGATAYQWLGGDRANGSRLRPLPAAHAVNAGILAGLARVAVADRFSVLTAFVEMGIQLAETEALRRA